MSHSSTSHQQAISRSPLFRPEVTAAHSQQWLGAIRLAQPNGRNHRQRAANADPLPGLPVIAKMYLNQMRKIVSVESVGEISVQHITVGNKCFWGGETSNHFILHHNLTQQASLSNSCTADDPNWMNE